MGQKKCRVIGVASGWGAQIRTCEEGPDYLKQLGCLDLLRHQKIVIEGWDTVYPTIRFRDQNIPLSEVLPLITDLNQRVVDQVKNAMHLGCFPIVIGGDHGNAVGTWNGVARALPDAPLGLLWIDAHMDAHTSETTPSGAWHGMPLAALLGYGRKELSELTSKQPIVKPEHVCLIGTRSYESGEADLLKELKVKIYFMEEVADRGFSVVLKEAIAHVNRGTQGYGVSLDVDVVDPSEAPGTGCFEPGGIAAKDLLQGLSLFQGDERLKAFELVEFNPSRDRDNMTAHLCQQILSAVLRGTTEAIAKFHATAKSPF